MIHAVAGGVINSFAQGTELISLLQQKRSEILEWLAERRDHVERREDRLETSEWAILIFVIISIVADLLLLKYH